MKLVATVLIALVKASHSQPKASVPSARGPAHVMAWVFLGGGGVTRNMEKHHEQPLGEAEPSEYIWRWWDGGKIQEGMVLVRRVVMAGETAFGGR